MYKKLAPAMMAVLMLGSALAVVPQAAESRVVEGPGADKVWVCKVVGPQGDYRLSTGKNPIEVSSNAADARQGFSDSHPSFIVEGPNDPECSEDSLNDDNGDDENGVEPAPFVRITYMCVAEVDGVASVYTGLETKEVNVNAGDHVWRIGDPRDVDEWVGISEIDYETDFLSMSGTVQAGEAIFHTTTDGIDGVKVLTDEYDNLYSGTASVSGKVCEVEEEEEPQEPENGDENGVEDDGEVLGDIDEGEVLSATTQVDAPAGAVAAGGGGAADSNMGALLGLFASIAAVGSGLFARKLMA